ncbi:MAG: 4-(cytidine 5'-diphospho)-2-C-methyl-D-erythritol kinase [Phycisphaerae bacterium]|nr:4-(cytidine 5'-diphospho)-2-C-methyl-D-erythritol kinase [Phycisphaerae bacterium]
MADMNQFEEVAGGLLVRAPAKINLSLLIAGKRPDGYHEIETLMAKVDYYDELFFESARREGIELVCEGRYWVPEGRENLVWRACRALLDVAGLEIGVRVTLHKNIPAGSGLGSGSSDAAAALMGLNRFANIGANLEQIYAAACTLGSDVPFFLTGPLAFCTGRGEKIEAVENFFPFKAVLALPDVSVQTKKVYDNYIHHQGEYDKLRETINSRLSKKRIDSVVQMCANMLETSCFELHPELLRLKRALEAQGVGPVMLSGSGSAMFCMVTSADSDTGCCQSMLSDSFGCESVVVNNNRW